MTIVEQIINREIEAVIIFENDVVIAFIDHDPINRGHVLICPKKSFRDFIDVPEDVMADVLVVARDIYRRVVKKYSPDGITFMQNNGSCNELGHYHLHIFPRFENDGFEWLCSEIGVQNIKKLEIDAVGLK